MRLCHSDYLDAFCVATKEIIITKTAPFGDLKH